MAAIAQNSAFFAIFTRYIHESHPDIAHVVDLCEMIYSLHRQPTASTVKQTLRAIFDDYIRGSAQTKIYSIIERLIDPAVGVSGFDPTLRGKNISTVAMRHSYDEVLSCCLEVLEASCLTPFLTSTRYDDISEIMLKQSQGVSTVYFQEVRMLGKGGFGDVVEVIKRDCGKRYAMKVMSKSRLVEAFGEDLWDLVVMKECEILIKLHHPLLNNLAYAFQNIDYLVLVLDVCDAGDLAVFGCGGKHKLTTAQLRFVGLEALAILAHLHSENILFRDMKPSNLLIDNDGHVRCNSRVQPGCHCSDGGTWLPPLASRHHLGAHPCLHLKIRPLMRVAPFACTLIRLIDFGTAKLNPDQKATAPPLSTEECGSKPYMAPEVQNDSENGYNCACDYFSYGVMMYELAEKQCAHQNARRAASCY